MCPVFRNSDANRVRKIMSNVLENTKYAHGSEIRGKIQDGNK